MFQDPVAEPRRRSLWSVSMALHGSAVAVVLGLPLLGAADEELPEPPMKPPVVEPFVRVSLGGGNPEPKGPEAPKPPKPRLAVEPVTQPTEPPPPLADPVDEPVSADPAPTSDGPVGDGRDGVATGGGGDGGPGLGFPDDFGTGGGTTPGVVDVHEVGVVAPVALVQTRPEFPNPLARLHMPGTVELSAVIETDGTVSSIEVLQATHPLFAQSAVRAVSQWVYRPGRVGDRLARVRMTVSVRFDLR